MKRKKNKDQSEEGFREEEQHQREYQEFQMEQEVFGNCCDTTSN